ncbi:MAG: hypothetical protein JSU08_14470 [Acidobacteria bacterium]|nr:hypothetical protein [Acidobacteriota bacterium]
MRASDSGFQAPGGVGSGLKTTSAEVRSQQAGAVDRVFAVRSGLSMRDAARIALTGIVFAFVLSLALTPRADAQQMRYMTGQNVVPVYEGWERNADGSFTMVFGYMNRNYEEEVDVPVGPDNRFEPLEADQGQPAHFYPRRQQFMFRVRVPKDWGQKDLVWTLTSHGKTEKAFGTLTPFWEIDSSVYQQNRGGPGDLKEPDAAPSISLVGPAQRSVKVGEPMMLEATVSDDGLPTFKPSRSGSGSIASASAQSNSVIPSRQNPLTQAVVRLDRNVRLGVTWVVHRRSVPADVTLSPMHVAVGEGGKASTTVTFTAPGTYTLRGYADDGILLGSTDVTFTVR